MSLLLSGRCRWFVVIFSLKIYLFIHFVYFWMRQVLVVSCELFVVARGLLSSCGVRVFSSLDVARRLQGSVVCGTQTL